MSGFSRFTPLVQSLPATVPFVGPETQERARGTPFAARIGANENGFGPAPSVVAAIAAAASKSWMYGDPENYDLKTALSAHLGVPFDAISVGEGIDSLLGLIVRMVATPDTAVVTSLGAYPTFNYHVAGFGARLITVPYRDDREDLQALADAARREDATLLYLANPDNPMGSWWDASEVADFVDRVPETTLIVLDEAYSEFAPADAILDNAAFIDRPNVIRTRTFSKAYGLAGLRVGYAFGHAQTIVSFDKVRNHFGINRVGQAAALAALADQAHLSEVLENVVACRKRIAAIAAANGLAALPSATNFVTIDCGRDGVFAKSVLDALVSKGIFVRMPGVAPLSRCIRVSCGPADQIDLFEAALPDVLAGL